MEQNTQFSHGLARYGTELRRVANGFAQGAERADLLQELLLAVWRAVPAFRSGALASTFINRVAHNTALTWRRTQKNFRERIDRFGQTPPSGPGFAGGRKREALEQLYTAIRRPPPLDRSIILLPWLGWFLIWRSPRPHAARHADYARRSRPGWPPRSMRTAARAIAPR